MEKLTFAEFQGVMRHDLLEIGECIEAEFCVDGCAEYKAANLGKTIDRYTNKEIYWFGLTEDGLQAYDFNSFEDFSNAKVFHGKDLKGIWESVSFYSIDACEVQERLPFYLGEKDEEL